MKMKTELLEINAELVRELKSMGKYKEAEGLIRAFRDNCSRQWVEDAKIEDKFERKIKKHLGICIRLRCSRPAIKGQSRCIICRDYQRIWRKNKNEICD